MVRRPMRGLLKWSWRSTEATYVNLCILVWVYRDLFTKNDPLSKKGKEPMIQIIVCEKLGGFPGYEFCRNMAMSNFSRE